MSKKEYPHSKLSELDDQELDQLLEEFPFTDLNQQKILKNIRQEQTTKRRFASRKMILTAVAAFVLLPTSALAVNRLWEVATSHEGFLTTLNIFSYVEPSEKYYKLTYSDLPQNLEVIPHTQEMKYWDPETQTDGFSAVLERVSDTASFEVPYSKGVVEEEVNQHRVWWVERAWNDSRTDTMAFVLFEEEGIVASIYFDETLSTEARHQIVSGMVLEETTAELASEIYEEIDEEEVIEGTSQDLSKESSTIKAFDTPFVVEYSRAETNLSIRMTISEPQITVSLPSAPAERSYNHPVESLKELGLVSETGELLAFEGTLYRRGDGVKTIDEAIETRTVQPHYVEMTFALENTSSEVIKDFYFMPQLVELEESVSGYRLVDHQTYMQPLDFNNGEEPAYLSGHGEGKAYYNIGDLQPGEANEVQIGFIATDSINPIFLRINVNGAGGTDLNAPDYQWLKLPEISK